MKTYTIFFLVFVIVLISRLPFITAGYGADSDSWRVATTARYMAITGEYRASRLPGFPVVEFVCSLAWKNGAWFLNLLTAIASAVTVGMFALIAKRYVCRNFMLLAFTFALTPIVYISSTITLDYMWAMMFVMLSWYTGFQGKSFVAGLLLGVATGCRITTITLALPFALIFFDRQNLKISILRIIKFWIGTCIVSAIVFLPVFLTYGAHLFSYFSQNPFRFLAIGKSITIDLWGVIGSFALIIIPFFILMNRDKNCESSIPEIFTNNQIKMWIAVLVLIVIEFIVLPSESAYLIPAIPFFLLLIAYYLSRIQFIIVCTLIIFSSFLISVDSHDRSWSPQSSIYSIVFNISGRSVVVDLLGPIFKDHERRLEQMQFVQTILIASDSIGRKSVIVAGPWLPKIIANTPEAMPESEFSDFSIHRKNVEFIGLMTRESLLQFRNRGYVMYHLESVDHYNKIVNGIDLAKEGVTEFTP